MMEVKPISAKNSKKKDIDVMMKSDEDVSNKSVYKPLDHQAYKV